MAATRTAWISTLLSMYIGSVLSQTAGSPCYNTSFNPPLPLRCEPMFSNVAYGLPIEATNTCGERVVNDATGRRYSPRKIQSFQTFYQQTGATGATKYRDFCDAESRNEDKRHPPQRMVDLDASHNRTWWQSITLYEYKERNLGDMVQASITLHLGKAFDITYIRLKFHSSRPESFAIYKKTSQNSTWEPYQFYSASCRSTYNLPQNSDIDTPTRAVCSGEYSDISPLSGGTVAFSTLEGRPYAYEFDKNKLLQEFVTATDIKIELTRLNTFGDEVFEDTSVLQSYYYAISDIAVGGRCKCNGHANTCVSSSSLEGDERLVCRCQHNTAGADCEKCLPFYNNKPWAAANVDTANACEQCNCNGRSEVCYFDQALYDLTGNGGHCRDCRDFTDGPNCERCKANYFRSDPRDICTPCNCDETGSMSSQCDSNGQCDCKPGVTGTKCDRCEANYYDFGTYGCRECGCVESGSLDNKPYCDSSNGQCVCKEYVEGQNCDRCLPGYFNLELDNRFGCIACFCYGKTSECSSAPGYVSDVIDSFFESGNEGWSAVTNDGVAYPTSFNAITGSLAISADGDSRLYFNAPSSFLGNHMYSYNQLLEFKLRIGEDSASPSQTDIILEGNGRRVFLPIFEQNNPIPKTTTQQYRFRLNEKSFYHWTPTLSALEFQKLLADLTAIRIRGAYNPTGTGFIDDVILHTAHNGQQVGDVTYIEQCVCPPQYIGQHCESCAPGYRREIPFGGSNTDCVPCECNGHSETCDAESGACICMHNTTGHNCEKCVEGFYGNPLTGTADDCQPCPCPGQGPCMEQLDFTVTCLECPYGYGGDLCDVCNDGFYGDPLTVSGNETGCARCDCNGNVDTNAVGNCHSMTGECLKCIYNTAGEHCELCEVGYFGDALSDVKGDCQSCECNEYGTNRSLLNVCNQTSGQCACLPYVKGRQCDQCEDGYYNLESTTGCEACLCDPVGSSDTKCDLTTGQCSCKPGIGGQRCDVCIADYFGFSKIGCEHCNCTEIGSLHGQCDDRGQCVCKDDTRITGLHCDECRENKYNLSAGCLDCPHCYNLVQDAANDIRKGLREMADKLANIRENPNVADDNEFNEQIEAVEDRIEQLYSRAITLQTSGAPLSEDLQSVMDDLNKLQMIEYEVLDIASRAKEKYSSLDLDGVNNRIQNVTDQIKTARQDFTETSTDYFTKVTTAINEYGQKSDNMTELSQISSDLADKQSKDADDIEMKSDDANEISNDAYTLALEVVKSPDSLSDELMKLKDRLLEADRLLSTVTEIAEKALEKATNMYTESISYYNKATSQSVEDYDTRIYVSEAESSLNESIRLKNKAMELKKTHEPLLNDSRIWMEKAEQAYDMTVDEQKVSDELMAEVDVALEIALQAVNDAKKLLAEAQERLRTLEEFDQRVQDNKDKAEEALKLIDRIEELIEQADNQTADARTAVDGARNATVEAEQIAVNAKNTAEQAGKNAADILSEVLETKEMAELKSNKTDELENDLQAVNKNISEFEPKVDSEQLLIDAVLAEAENAKKIAALSLNKLSMANKNVAEIIQKFERLEPLNTTELDALEAEIDNLEGKYLGGEVDKYVDELEKFETYQVNVVNLFVADLNQLKLAVDNIQEIVNVIPEKCYSKPVLEPGAEEKRKRKRQRRFRKKLRQ